MKPLLFLSIKSCLGKRMYTYIQFSFNQIDFENQSFRIYVYRKRILNTISIT